MRRAGDGYSLRTVLACRDFYCSINIFTFIPPHSLSTTYMPMESMDVWVLGIRISVYLALLRVQFRIVKRNQPMIFALAQSFHQVKKISHRHLGKVLLLIPQWTESGMEKIYRNSREEWLIHTRVFVLSWLSSVLHCWNDRYIKYNFLWVLWFRSYSNYFSTNFKNMFDLSNRECDFSNFHIVVKVVILEILWWWLL